jgi:acyl-CoA oxidase
MLQLQHNVFVVRGTHIGMPLLLQMYAGRAAGDARQLHLRSCALKAAATWSRWQVLQHCRECCGGQGFLAANRIGRVHC